MISIDLENKLAVITGATGQLGRVMVDILSECGADIAVHYYKDIEKADELIELIRSRGGKANSFNADITNHADVFEMKKRINKEMGEPDIVVCNAVIQYNWKPILEQSDIDYYSQFESCVMQSVHMAKAFIPAMKNKHYGRFIAINTECAMLAEANCSAYASGKRGLDGFIRVLAKEVGEFGITVNQIAPGWTITEMERSKRNVDDGYYISQIPLKRRGNDYEIGNMVAFLASDLAGYITGAFIPVTGGHIMPAI